MEHIDFTKLVGNSKPLTREEKFKKGFEAFLANVWEYDTTSLPGLKYLDNFLAKGGGSHNSRLKSREEALATIMQAGILKEGSLPEDALKEMTGMLLQLPNNAPYRLAEKFSGPEGENVFYQFCSESP